MRENRTSGTVWGVSGNRHSYHDGKRYGGKGESENEQELWKVLAKEFVNMY